MALKTRRLACADVDTRAESSVPDEEQKSAEAHGRREELELRGPLTLAVEGRDAVVVRQAAVWAVGKEAVEIFGGEAHEDGQCDFMGRLESYTEDVRKNLLTELEDDTGQHDMTPLRGDQLVLQIV